MAHALSWGMTAKRISEEDHMRCQHPSLQINEAGICCDCDAVVLTAVTVAVLLPVDTSTITEYGLTQRLSFQIRVF